MEVIESFFSIIHSWRPAAAGVVVFFSFLAGRAQELSAEMIYAKTLPSVLTLRVESKSGERYVGTAFLGLAPGIAITAWHVVHDAAKITANFADGTTFSVDGVVDYDTVKDVALVRVSPSQRRLLPASPGVPRVGARAFVIGAPKGYEFSISDGIVSQLQRVDGFEQYQLSCPFSPGNSGGPVLNAKGEVIGIASWTRNGGQNLNFATPIAEAVRLDPNKPVIPWKSLRKKPTRTSENRKASSPATDSARDAQSFKSILQKSVGKEITITVTQDGQKERFQFTVPPNFGQ